MYGEVSFVISLGLILILILTHFDFKSKLFNFENQLKTNEKTFKNKIDKMRGKVQGNYKKFVGPIDCSGEWKCNDKCIKTFIVDTYPRYGGNACPTGSDSVPVSGLGSEECVPGTNCPEDIDCVWDWTDCRSNCLRDIDIITQSSGDGTPCPINRIKAEEEEIMPSCLDDIGGGKQQCVPSDCEGHWGSCGIGCEQTYQITQESIYGSDCEFQRGETKHCTGGECIINNKDCEWHWSPCTTNCQRQDIYDIHSRNYRKIIIDSLPEGNGSSCPFSLKNTEWDSRNPPPNCCQ